MAIDWAQSGRRDEYTFYLVDPFSLSEMGTCELNPGGSSITWGYFTDNIYQASLDIESDNYQLDSKSYLVRIKDRITIGPYSNEYTIGTVFVDSSSGSTKYKRLKRSATGYSTMWRHTQDILVNDFQVRTGDNVVEKIKKLVEDGGGTFMVKGDNGLTLDLDPDYWDIKNRVVGSDKIYPIGTSVFDVIFELSENINCEIIPDEYGRIVLQKYLPYNHRDVKYVFEEGKYCTCLPGISWSQTSTEMYNRVLVYYSTENKTERVVCDLTDENSFLSYESSGIRKTAVIQKSQETSLDDMKREGYQYLKEHTDTLYDIEIEHVYIPELHVGDVVRYINDSDAPKPVNELFLVVESSMNFKPGGKVKSKLRTFKY